MSVNGNFLPPISSIWLDEDEEEAKLHSLETAAFFEGSSVAGTGSGLVNGLQLHSIHSNKPCLAHSATLKLASPNEEAKVKSLCKQNLSQAAAKSDPQTKVREFLAKLGGKKKKNNNSCSIFNTKTIKISEVSKPYGFQHLSHATLTDTVESDEDDNDNEDFHQSDLSMSKNQYMDDYGVSETSSITPRSLSLKSQGSSQNSFFETRLARLQSIERTYWKQQHSRSNSDWSSSISSQLLELDEEQETSHARKLSVHTQLDNTEDDEKIQDEDTAKVPHHSILLDSPQSDTAWFKNQTKASRDSFEHGLLECIKDTNKNYF